MMLSYLESGLFDTTQASNRVLVTPTLTPPPSLTKRSHDYHMNLMGSVLCDFGLPRSPDYNQQGSLSGSSVVSRSVKTTVVCCGLASVSDHVSDLTATMVDASQLTCPSCSRPWTLDQHP